LHLSFAHPAHQGIFENTARLTFQLGLLIQFVSGKQFL
jgi:hypothetical protein